MLWITPERDYLVEGESCSLPDGAEIAGDPGSPSLRPAKFYLVSKEGEVKCAYSEPRSYGIDNELGLTNIHAISGDTVQVYHCREFWGPGRPPDEVSSRVLIAGLCPIDLEEMPFDRRPVVAAHEAKEAQEREQREAGYRAEWQEEAEEMVRFREGLQQQTSPVDATWEFEADCWVVKRIDGLVLGRGKVRGYGIDVYRKLLAIMSEQFGSSCSLEVKITPAQWMRFYSD